MPAIPAVVFSPAPNPDPLPFAPACVVIAGVLARRGVSAPPAAADNVDVDGEGEGGRIGEGGGRGMVERREFEPDGVPEGVLLREDDGRRGDEGVDIIDSGQTLQIVSEISVPANALSATSRVGLPSWLTMRRQDGFNFPPLPFTTTVTMLMSLFSTTSCVLHQHSRC